MTHRPLTAADRELVSSTHAPDSEPRISLVAGIRRQLARDLYETDYKLDVALDRLLEDVLDRPWCSMTPAAAAPLPVVVVRPVQNESERPEVGPLVEPHC